MPTVTTLRPKSHVDAQIAPELGSDLEFARPPTVGSLSGANGPSWRPADVHGGAEVRISVLGRVEVTGALRPLQRAWTLELVVYLALHPDGVTNSKWAAALWPDRVPADATLHSTVSAARRALGTSRTGRDHLLREQGSLRLGAGVGTDWGVFGSLAGSRTQMDWCCALSLVRGRIFDGLRDTDWTLFEGCAALIEGDIVELAQRVASNALAKGDGARAAWAARQGLRASPFDERLYRVLLRAADAEGNPAGVEAVIAELCCLLSTDHQANRAVAPRFAPLDLDALVHPETAALYRALSRRSRSVTGRVPARL